MTKKRILMIGVGISNSSLARLLLDSNYKVEIREKLKRPGGMLRDMYDAKSSCYVSNYGPHIINFNKDTKKAENFLTSKVELTPFIHKVLCLGDSGAFTYWPINNPYLKLFKILNPKKSVFDEFIIPYSKKMWGSDYKNKIDVIRSRFKSKNSNNNDFFEGKHQYQPIRGYSKMMSTLISGASVKYNRIETFKSLKNELKDWDSIIVSSHIDEFFGFKYGKLDYRGLDFEVHNIETDGEQVLPTPVVNLNTNKKYIRATEMNLLQSKINKSKNRVIVLDFPSTKNRFYPVETKENLEKLDKYNKMAKKYDNIIFHGRLGTFKYLDIDDCVMESLKIYEKITKFD